jgi:hypothetical protein
MSKCDGVKTGRDLFDELKNEDIIFSGTQPEEFADAVQVLVSGGFVRIKEQS